MTRIAAALVFAFSAAGALAQPAAAPVSATAPASAYDLEADVQRAMKVFDVPGVAIAIVKDGKVVATRGFGVRELGKPTPVDGKTIFEIASNSKAFTAAALAMLVDEGKLKWDDPVTKHLPDFQMYDPYVTHEMTVRDLLVHRSGLGLGAGDLLWWPTTQFSTDDIIHRLRYIKPATSFRNSYAYDNLLYIVAGKIIAQKSGKSWGETIRERILKPVGMNDTTVSLAENAARANVSSPHSKVDGTTRVVTPMPVDNAVGAVGLNTNAEDIAKWMMVLMNEGVIGKDAAGKEQRLFSAKQSREMWTAQTPMKIGEPSKALASTKPNFFAYGLGFQLRDYKGRKLAMHGGALFGFYSRVLMVPEENLGIAILTNAENGGVMTSLSYRIMDHYLKVPATDWIKLFNDAEKEAAAKDLAQQQKVKGTRPARSSPSLPLASYEGTYVDPWYGDVTIKKVGNKQVMSFSKTPSLTGELEHFQHDTFIVRWNERSFRADAYVTFQLNPDGSIDRVKMAPVSDETDFSFDFADLALTPVKQAK
ncbi:serine hydrolase [Massilia sp. PAMC28688]|uniref:serine hydrolase n=1 Tax=Massilia sp. PAMC28688 TaxID=2861283 RepID=UPI001C6367ED|nr:serine hydrolase [Massilia sp. PAMC28688]QYF95949.1 serine hydrolase [Massilia sp. PAMC28688]